MTAALLEHETLDELEAYRVAEFERAHDGATRRLPAAAGGEPRDGPSALSAPR